MNRYTNMSQNMKQMKTKLNFWNVIGLISKGTSLFWYEYDSVIWDESNQRLCDTNLWWMENHNLCYTMKCLSLQIYNNNFPFHDCLQPHTLIFNFSNGLCKSYHLPERTTSKKQNYELEKSEYNENNNSFGALAFKNITCNSC